MRAGSSSMVAQQSLTPDASAIIKQALTLARHRGHTQVTPFHVAITLLSLPNNLLRSSCLHSHSQTHPLRTRALDLCFNVALNRLPSSSSTMMLGSFRVHNKPPSLSNALMATFKRAQAHQRRGSEQQMMINAVRIDVEQLIMSILDDPSISRVMKEAGFASAQVKAFIDKVSPELNTKEVRKADKSLDLNLNCDSNSFRRIKRNGSHGSHHEITNEVVYSSSSDVSPSSSYRASALPSWLLQQDEGRRIETSGYKVSVPNSSSSTETSEVNYLLKFNELNAENLKILCDSLLNISCQKQTVSEIASTILKCRSGINKRNDMVKEDTWLFFLGIDIETKQKIARELATVVFGSQNNIVSIAVSNTISCQKYYFERLAGAVQENPHRVFLLEDIDKVDYCTQVAILNAVGSGSVSEDVCFNDAIVILSCERFNRNLKTKGREDGASFDLNRCAENDEFDFSFDSVGLLDAVDRTIIFNCINDL